MALTLAVSFGFYGLVKKTAPLGALHGLTLETGILFLPALVFLVFSQFTRTGAFLHSTTLSDVMLVGAGLVTVVPLMMFALAAPRISLTTIGVLQYVNPTMQFLLGVLIFKEPFDHHRLIGFDPIRSGRFSGTAQVQGASNRGLNQIADEVLVRNLILIGGSV